MRYRVIAKSQWIVWWLEVDEENDQELVRKEAIFSDEEEMVSFLSLRLETAIVYAWLGSVESYWYETEGELESVEETPANGFYLVDKSVRTVAPLYDSYEEWLKARGGKASRSARDEAGKEE